MDNQLENAFHDKMIGVYEHARKDAPARSLLPLTSPSYVALAPMALALSGNYGINARRNVGKEREQ